MPGQLGPILAVCVACLAGGQDDGQAARLATPPHPGPPPQAGREPDLSPFRVASHSGASPEPVRAMPRNERQAIRRPLPPPSAGPQPLTLDALERLALRHNPTIRAAEALVQQQQGLLRQVTRYP